MQYCSGKYFPTKVTHLRAAVMALLFCVCVTPAHAVFINEIHYDNAGSDVGEGIELAGDAGVDLAGWSLEFYNGRNGEMYKRHELQGAFADMQAGFGVLSFAIRGLQNGSPDGVALVNDAGVVEEFLSYEGVMYATDGAAAGLTSVDIGIAESSNDPLGGSLQLQGSGYAAGMFSWVSAAASFGRVNAQQSFVIAQSSASSRSLQIHTVPEPTSWLLMLSGLVMILFVGCCRVGLLVRWP